MNPPTRLSILWIHLALTTITLAVFWQTRQFDFINFDDFGYVRDNPHIRNGLTWHGIRWAFSAGLFFSTVNADYWQPITWLSRMLDIQLFGLNPSAHHLMNVGYHLLNTLLLFHVLRRMTGSTARSAWVAALFSIHPIHVESVAWIVERKDTLSGLFWILTVWAYVRFVEAGKEGRGEWGKRGLRAYALVVLMFATALMSKPMVVTLPFVLLLLDYWPLKRIRLNLQPEGQWRQVILEKLPLLALSVISCAITLGSLSGFLRHDSANNVGINVLASYGWYFWKMAYPTSLAIFYPRPQVVSTIEIVLPALLLTAGSVWVIRWATRRPYLLVGWFWFIGMLLPVTNLSDIIMADRFTYVASIGALIMLVWWGAEWLPESRFRRPLLHGGATILIGALIFLSWRQTGYWKNSVTVFEHALQATSNNSEAHLDLAKALAADGKTDEALKHYQAALKIDPEIQNDYLTHYDISVALSREEQIEEAMAHCASALKINPAYAPAHNRLGNLLSTQGKLQEAIVHWKESLRIDPTYAEPHYNWGRILVLQDQKELAEKHYLEALRLQPAYTDAYNNLGTLLIQEGRVEEGLQFYLTALSLNPSLPKTQFNLGCVYFQKGHTQEAILHLGEAIKLDPHFSDAHETLGSALDKAGQPAQAIQHLEEALRLKPDFAEAHNDLGIVLVKQGRAEKAAVHFAEALRLKPDSLETLCNLGNVNLQLGRPREAISYYQRAIKLRADWIQGYCYLATGFEKLGNYAEAMKAARTAAKLASRQGQPKLALEIEKQAKFYEGKL